MNVLLSIKPEHVENILNGSKKYEFRRKVFSREVTKVVIYCTKPVGKIVAEFSIDCIHEGAPDAIWDKTSVWSGISRDFFNSYFEGREKAYAIEIGELNVFQFPIDPGDLIDNFTAPQSYRYLPTSASDVQMELPI